MDLKKHKSYYFSDWSRGNCNIDNKVSNFSIFNTYLTFTFLPKITQFVDISSSLLVTDNFLWDACSTTEFEYCLIDHGARNSSIFNRTEHSPRNWIMDAQFMALIIQLYFHTVVKGWNNLTPISHQISKTRYPTRFYLPWDEYGILNFVL